MGNLRGPENLFELHDYSNFGLHEFNCYIYIHDFISDLTHYGFQRKLLQAIMTLLLTLLVTVFNEHFYKQS